jgi:hypothetical protein
MIFIYINKTNAYNNTIMSEMNMYAVVMAKSDKGLEIIDKITALVYGDGECKVSRFDYLLQKVCIIILNEYPKIYKDHVILKYVKKTIVNQVTIAWDGKKETIYLLNNTDKDEYNHIQEIPYTYIVQKAYEIRTYNDKAHVQTTKTPYNSDEDDM